MATVTFIIGNGFDINLGLKTRFKDVYPSYLEQDSKSSIIQQFKMTIGDSKDTEKWADFEMAMANYAKTFNNENELIECLTDFRKYLKTYILEEQTRFLNSLTESIKTEAIVNETIRSIQSYCKGVSKNITKQFSNKITALNFITYNYTNILDTLIKSLDATVSTIGIPIKTLHLHGSLDDTPVLGIDNLTQVDTSYKITKSGQRALIKPIFNKEYDNARIINAENMINTADCLCIFGFSLGDSDLTWRNLIKDWLLGSSLHHLFYYSRELIIEEARDAYEKLDLEDAKREELLYKLNIKLDDKILTQVHLPCGNKIFNYTPILKFKSKQKNNTLF